MKFLFIFALLISNVLNAYEIKTKNSEILKIEITSDVLNLNRTYDVFKYSFQSFKSIESDLNDFYLPAGDWYNVKLNSVKEKVLLEGKMLLSEDRKEFTTLKNLINKNLTKEKNAKYLGLLFERDWYMGNGTIRFVFKYENTLVVIPFEFSVNTKFGFKDLDSVY